MTAPVVVVAHETDAIRATAAAAAREAGYDVVEVADGIEAEVALGASRPPAALVVDAGLPGRAGFELCEMIESRGLPTRVVLIASVYSKTAYKRKPTQLYGAHDYVEQHHIVDMLGDKLAALIPSGRVAGTDRSAGSPAADPRAGFEAVREAGEARLRPISRERERSGHDHAVARARQLARLIVTDLLLYSGSEAQSWAAAEARAGRRGSGAMPPRLLDDLNEARRLLDLSVPADVAGGRDLIGEAFVELVVKERPE